MTSRRSEWWDAYMLLWCCANIVRIVSGLNPSTALKDTVSAEPKLLLLCMMVLTLSNPSKFGKWTVLLRIVTNVAKGPWMGNSQLWATMMDASLFLEDPSSTIKTQLTIFYLASAFWKLNTSFMDPEYSCASIFCLQPMEYLPERFWNKSLAMAIVRVAPIATLVLEFAIAFTGPVLFHLMIAFTPPPSNVSSFGVTTCTRLFFYAPQELSEKIKNPSKTLLGFMVAAPAVALAIVHPFHSRAVSTVQGSGPDLHLAYFVSLAILLFSVKFRRQNEHHAKINKFLVSLAFAYAFVLPILGLQEKGGCLMFSQLRMHGGSNHYLLPTSLLQKWYSDSDPASALSGGVVRILHAENLTNLGNTFAEHMSPRTLRLVREYGEVRSEYVWAAKATPNPRPSPPPRFFQFTISNLGLRRLLQQYQGPFSITYQRLHGPVGDEIWRTTTEGTQHVVEKTLNGTLICPSCDSRELELIHPSTRLNFLTAMLLPQVNPIVPGLQNEMHCVTWG